MPPPGLEYVHPGAWSAAKPGPLPKVVSVSASLWPVHGLNG